MQSKRCSRKLLDIGVTAPPAFLVDRGRVVRWEGNSVEVSYRGIECQKPRVRQIGGLRKSSSMNRYANNRDAPSWWTQALSELEASGLRRELSIRNGPQGPRIEIDGRDCVNFGANDYLGLANDPRLVEAAIRAATEEGWGSAASPLVSGHSRSQATLEAELAEFEQADAALVFSSGFAANLGVITALAGKGDVIYSDAKNHASIIDGCRLSGALLEIYRHNDADHLAELLESSRHSCRRALIVTDGLFSMDGDFAPLSELVRLADRHQALLVVDEAHATGVWGPNGRGTCEHFGIEDSNVVRVGTLSKALGSIGGFVVGEEELVAWIANKARSFVFSTALPSASLSAARAALRIVREEPHRREQLRSLAAHLRDLLASEGWQVPASVSQIIPIHVGEPNQTMSVAVRLRQAGLFVPGIRPPSVPVGESLLRISLSYLHDATALEVLVAELARLRASPE